MISPKAIVKARAGLWLGVLTATFAPAAARAGDCDDFVAWSEPGSKSLRDLAREVSELLGPHSNYRADTRRVVRPPTRAQLKEAEEYRQENVEELQDLLKNGRAQILGLERRQPLRTDACLAHYREVFADQRFEFRVVIGYNDTRSDRFVEDQTHRAEWIRHLTAACQPGVPYLACGFHVEGKIPGGTGPLDSAPVVLERPLLGPDGKLKTIRISLVAAAIGLDDNQNRISDDQVEHSLETAGLYLQGLQSADAVIYLGHNRSGGGPDFAPPILNAANNPNYLWYRKFQPGIKLTEAGLRGRSSKLKYVALLGCTSRPAALPLINAHPDVAFMSSRLWLYSDDLIYQSLRLIHGVMSYRCDPAFFTANPRGPIIDYRVARGTPTK